MFANFWGTEATPSHAMAKTTWNQTSVGHKLRPVTLPFLAAQNPCGWDASPPSAAWRHCCGHVGASHSCGETHGKLYGISTYVKTKGKSSQKLRENTWRKHKWRHAWKHLDRLQGHFRILMIIISVVIGSQWLTRHLRHCGVGSCGSLWPPSCFTIHKRFIALLM